MRDVNGDPLPMDVHHRGVVMPWECDDMGHMNIRFHVARYGQALRHAALSGAPFVGDGSCRVADRFVFLKEARVGARVECALSVNQEKTGVARVVASLRDISSDEVLARFETDFARDGGFSIADELSGDEVKPEKAGEDGPVPEWITAMGAPASTALEALDMAEALTAIVSDANALAILDLSRGGGWRMERSSVGFVVAELAFRHFGGLAGVTAFSAHTALTARSRRSLTFRHRITGPGGGFPVATVRAACVFFDRETRRSAPVPFEPDFR